MPVIGTSLQLARNTFGQFIVNRPKRQVLVAAEFVCARCREVSTGWGWTTYFYDGYLPPRATIVDDGVCHACRKKEMLHAMSDAEETTPGDDPNHKAPQMTTGAHDMAADESHERIESRITLFGDGDLVILAPRRARPANRALAEAWLKRLMDQMFADVGPGPEPAAKEGA